MKLSFRMIDQSNLLVTAYVMHTSRRALLLQHRVKKMNLWFQPLQQTIRTSKSTKKAAQSRSMGLSGTLQVRASRCFSWQNLQMLSTKLAAAIGQSFPHFQRSFSNHWHVVSCRYVPIYIYLVIYLIYTFDFLQFCWHPKSYVISVFLINLRTQLQEKALSMKMSKAGKVDDIKSRLIVGWLSQSTQEEIIKYSGLTDVGESVPVAASQAAQCAEQSHAGGGGEASGSAEMTMFGRSTFAMVPAEVEDKTEFFTGIDKGPALKDAEQTSAEIIEKATDGLIPVAALVKITQGFQEALNDQVAVLLSGANFPMSSFMLLRRIYYMCKQH